MSAPFSLYCSRGGNGGLARAGALAAAPFAGALAAAAGALAAGALAAGALAGAAVCGDTPAQANAPVSASSTRSRPLNAAI
ncbi:MAG TPA: hypothetical protein VMT14_24555 [Burkholderiaceae bacterium]|nr:hypothetical protein [Burkholderiaceae bacterium]